MEYESLIWLRRAPAVQDDGNQLRGKSSALGPGV